MITLAYFSRDNIFNVQIAKLRLRTFQETTSSAYKMEPRMETKETHSPVTPGMHGNHNYSLRITNY